MSITSIEWVAGPNGERGHTVNPIRARNLETGAVGHFCEKISPGCTNCYASDWNERVRPQASGKLIGTGLTFDARNRDKVECFLDESKLNEVLRKRKPTRWFWCDMTDMFGAWVPDEWLDRMFAVMALTPQHTHLVLTKRAERMRAYFDLLTEEPRNGVVHRLDLRERIDDEAGNFGACHANVDAPGRWPLPNVRLGVSVEDKARAERFDVVCELGERGWNTMVSMEPLLDDVEIPARYLALGSRAWVIPGGESGRRARACNVAWVRRPVQQCKAAGVAVFCKQLGAQVIDQNDAGFEGDTPHSWPMDTDTRSLTAQGWQGDPVRVLLRDKKGGTPEEWPPDLRIRQFPRSETP